MNVGEVVRFVKSTGRVEAGEYGKIVTLFSNRAELMIESGDKVCAPLEALQSCPIELCEHREVDSSPEKDKIDIVTAKLEYLVSLAIDKPRIEKEKAEIDRKIKELEEHKNALRAEKRNLESVHRKALEVARRFSDKKLKLSEYGIVTAIKEHKELSRYKSK